MGRRLLRAGIPPSRTDHRLLKEVRRAAVAEWRERRRLRHWLARSARRECPAARAMQEDVAAEPKGPARGDATAARGATAATEARTANRARRREVRAPAAKAMTAAAGAAQPVRTPAGATSIGRSSCD